MGKSPPLEFHVDDNAKPHAIYKPSPIPLNYMARIKSEVDKDVRLGVIAPVPENTPVEWCSQMNVIAKKDGDPRRVIDLRKVNEATKR